MVFLQSFSSRASRIAATLPSIISDGAITSAPAFTRLTDIFAKSGSVSSFKISPSHTRPQCPWDVYSHRHTSAITRSSGIRFLMWRIARCVTPSSFVNYLFACYAIPLVIFATRLWMAALKNRITNAVNSITSAMDVAPA